MPLNQAMVLVSLGLLQRHNTSTILEELNQKLVNIVKTGWKVFPFTNTIIFYYIPFLIRPLFVNIVALLWFTFVAWEANKKATKDTKWKAHTGAKTNFLSRNYEELDVWKCEFCEKWDF